MATGKVKWFNDQKGYGFIIPDDNSEELFVHHTNVQMTGFRTLKENQPVEFTAERGQKGLEAKSVVPKWMIKNE